MISATFAMLILLYGVDLFLSSREKERLRADAARDASELERLKRALRDERARLRLLIEHAPAPLAMFDRDMRYLACSQRWRSDYGLNDLELFGQSHYDILPELGPAWKSLHQRALAGEHLSSDGEPVARADGREQYIRWEICPWRDPSGAVAGIIVSLYDLTEVRDAQTALEDERARLEEQVMSRTAELRLQTERLELAATAGGIGIWSWDQRTGALAWDDQVRRLYGLANGALEPSYHRWLTWVFAEDRQRIADGFERALRSADGIFDEVFRVHCRDGRERHLASRGRLRTLAGDTREVVLGVTWDVTADVVGGNALKASEARARTVIEHSPVPLAIAHRTGPIRFLNAAFSETFGYTVGDLESWTDWWRLALPDAAERGRLLDLTDQRLAASRRGSGVFEPIELQVRCKDGRTRVVVVRVTPLEDDEWLNTFYDITELEEARENAELAAEARSQFLSQMSHEIRTPLNVVLGLAQVLDKTPLAPDQRSMLRQLRTAGRSLLEILNDILDLARIEAGRFPQELSPFSLHAVLGQVMRFLDAMAADKGLRLTAAEVPTLEGGLLGDARRVEQILVNLVGNAIKFTDFGEVRIKARLLSCTDHYASYRFEVIDTGIGIPRETLVELFAPYVQGGTQVNQRFGGTGLGLSICKRLVEAMDGHIGVESQVGVGSLFWFELTFARTKESPERTSAAIQSRSPDGQPLAGVRVLLVDDSEMSREVVEHLLLLEGAAVGTAADGRQALECLRTAEFDLVLMDVQMPVLDGLEAAALIRSDLGLVELPIVALTAGVLPEQRAAAKAAGMNAFLTKPIDDQQMVATIRDCLGGLSEAEPREPSEVPTQGFRMIAGLDQEAFFSALRGNRARMEKLLARFAEDCAPMVAEARCALAAGDRATAIRLMHSLAGNAGTISATSVMASARAAEAAIDRQEPGFEQLLEAVDGHLQRLIAAIESWRAALRGEQQAEVNDRDERSPTG